MGDWLIFPPCPAPQRAPRPGAQSGAGNGGALRHAVVELDDGPGHAGVTLLVAAVRLGAQDDLDPALAVGVARASGVGVLRRSGVGALVELGPGLESLLRAEEIDRHALHE